MFSQGVDTAHTKKKTCQDSRHGEILRKKHEFEEYLVEPDSVDVDTSCQDVFCLTILDYFLHGFASKLATNVAGKFYPVFF